MAIYTKRGDDGETDLFGSGGDVRGARDGFDVVRGERAANGAGRVAKNDPRIEAIGTVDELNSLIGVVIAAGPSDEVAQFLRELQRDLFVLGADLATPTKVAVRGKDDVPRVSEGRIVEFEKMIDRYEEALPKMTAFIMPGGCEVSARLHVARSVCRRAERVCVGLLRLEAEKNIGSANSANRLPTVVRFLNRLSDLLFVLARRENANQGGVEETWES